MTPAPWLQREAMIPGEKSAFDSSADRIRSEAVDWHVRLQSGRADVQADFAVWRAASPEHARAYDRIGALWASPELTAALVELRPNGAVAKPVLHPWPVRQWGIGIAAGIAVVGLIAWQGPELLLRSQADFLTERGAVQRYALPDGSSLTLNSGSAVAIDFADGRRHVALLRGEAYFDVVADPEHPFTVSGLTSEVRVTGTEFSLQAAAGEDRLTVAEGHVRFRGNGASQPIDVLAGQAAAASTTGEPVAADTDVAQALAWRDGRIAIATMPLWQALDELQRYRPAPVMLASLDRRDIKVTGDFRIDDIDSAVVTLGAAAGLSATALPGSILLLH